MRVPKSTFTHLIASQVEQASSGNTTTEEIRRQLKIQQEDSNFRHTGVTPGRHTFTTHTKQSKIWRMSL